MGNSGRQPGKIEWEISVPIFRNHIIIKQLAIAIGLPFGVLTVALLFTAGQNAFRTDLLYALGLIGGLFILTYILIMIVYGGKYDAGFVIDANGILCYTQKKQARINRIINFLTVLMGLFSRTPAAAGAGILAQSRQTEFLSWNEIKKVEYQPKQHVVTVRGGFTEKVALFCTEDNYGEVEKLIKSYCSVKSCK